MSNTKFTPGPWRVGEVSEEMRKAIFQNDGICAICVMTETVFEDHFQVANAKLIAAAPELLESVRQFVWNWENDIWTDADIEAAKAAIKKATE